jgi:hypothetical protein
MPPASVLWFLLGALKPRRPDGGSHAPGLVVATAAALGAGYLTHL